MSEGFLAAVCEVSARRVARRAKGWRGRGDRGGACRAEGLERRVFLSSAVASFGAQQTFGSGAGPHSVALADLNKDGVPDLVVADEGAGVSVLLGNGDGTFKPRTALTAGSKPIAVVVADVNRDGNADLAVANLNSANVSAKNSSDGGTIKTVRMPRPIPLSTRRDARASLS